MSFKLRTKLSLSYALTALLLVASISVITNVFMQKQFNQYIKNQREVKNQDTAALIARQFNLAPDTTKLGEIESIGIRALEQGTIIKVFDNSNNTIWDATQHNLGLCNEMIAHMAMDMENRMPYLKVAMKSLSTLLIYQLYKTFQK